MMNKLYCIMINNIVQYKKSVVKHWRKKMINLMLCGNVDSNTTKRDDSNSSPMINF